MPTARRLLELLRARGLRLAVAESFTGGRIQDRLTDVPGCSDVFVGGLVAYHNDLKAALLGVKASTLNRHGAVSRECVQQMAAAIRRRMRADLGLATTGIAGPTGSTATKPLGLTFVAVATRRSTRVEQRVFRGRRDDVKEKATRFALDLVARSLRNP